MKWPTPEALKDLEIVELPNGGLEFSAPEGTECAKWLDYYDQTDELRKQFSDLIINAIMKYTKEVEECGPT